MLAFDAMRSSDSSTLPTVNQVAVQVTEAQPGLMAFIAKMLWATRMLVNGEACRRTDDRGRRIALDRALAAGRSRRPDPHRGRIDVGGPQRRLAAGFDA